jgi:hypothetical protein
MWTVRLFGWGVTGMGTASFLLIPWLIAVGRSNELPSAIGVGLVCLAIGVILVKVTKPDQ